MRVLHVVDSLDMGGIQTFLLNLYKTMNKDRIQFDFMVFRNHEQVLEKEFLNLGAKIYKLPNWRCGIHKNHDALKKFFADHKEYEILHYHAGTLVDIEPLLAAKRAGIPVRIMHSHNTHAAGSIINTWIHKWNKKRIASIATNAFACGIMAGQWMFGGTPLEQNIKIINNGIPVEQYSYNPEVQIKKRKELTCDNNHHLIGHIGRFSPQKNQMFLLEVMKIICQETDSVELFFVGDGPDSETVKAKVKEYGLERHVHMLGIRKDVNELLQAFDVFALPSLFEGFPVVLVEAQAAGLPCVIADTISNEVVINENVQSLPLNSPNEWAVALAKKSTRNNDYAKLIQAGFDSCTTAKQLEAFYYQQTGNEHEF